MKESKRVISPAIRCITVTIAELAKHSDPSRSTAESLIKFLWEANLAQLYKEAKLLRLNDIREPRNARVNRVLVLCLCFYK